MIYLNIIFAMNYPQNKSLFLLQDVTSKQKTRPIGNIN